MAYQTDALLLFLSRKIVFILCLLVCRSGAALSQKSIPDSTTAKTLFEKASAFNGKNTDSAIFYIRKCISFTETRDLPKIRLQAISFYGELAGLTGDVSKADSLYNKAIELSEKSHNYRLLSVNYLSLGILNYRSGEYKKALHYDQLALRSDSLIGSKRSPGKIYQNIGNVYNALANYPLALDYYYRSIKEFLKDSSLVGLGGTYCNIGLIYASQKDYDKAIGSYRSALSYLKRTNNINFLINTTANLGVSLDHKGLHDSALFYYFTALKDAQKIKNVYAESACLSNIGITYVRESRFAEARGYLLKSLAIAESLGDSSSLSELKINLATCSMNTGDYRSAIADFQQGYVIGKNIGENELIITALHGLFKAYYANGQFREASFYLNECFNLKDSIFNLENTKQLSDLKTNFEVEKKEAEFKIRSEAQQALADAEKKRQSLIIYAVAGVLMIVMIFSALLYKRLQLTNRQKRIIEAKEREAKQQNVIIIQQKHLVEEKHKEITDSINYAERIQRSFLATKDLLDQNLKDYFVLFRPKDVVSGDFYWAAREGSLFYLCTADSTGHGVPGAIMSLLNITSLEKAIEHHSSPEEILNHTRQTIISRLKKDGSAEGGKDGMDCSLLAFDPANYKLKISAANNPVWIVRDADASENKEVLEIRPDKMPVGKHDKDKEPFTLHEISLKKGDVIYTLTDGFPDQFGGAKGKKFMSKSLRELLVANSHLPMSEQKQLLERTFSSWKEGLEQVDDVTVIGIRL